MVSHALQLALLGLNNTLESCPVPGQDVKPRPYSHNRPPTTSRPSDGFRSNPGPRNPGTRAPKPPRTTRWRARPRPARIPPRAVPPGTTPVAERAAERVAERGAWRLLGYGAKFLIRAAGVAGWVYTAYEFATIVSEERDAERERFRIMRTANAAHMVSGEGDYLELLRSAPYPYEPSHAMELERAEKEEEEAQRRECLRSGGSFRECMGIPDLPPGVSLPASPKLTPVEIQGMLDHLGLPQPTTLPVSKPASLPNRPIEVIPPQIEIATRERLALLEDHELELLQASKDPVEVYLASQLLAERQMEREIAERREQERQRANGGPTIIGSGKIVHGEKSAPGPKHGRTHATPVASTGEGPKNTGAPTPVGSTKGQPGSKPAGPDEAPATGPDAGERPGPETYFAGSSYVPGELMQFLGLVQCLGQVLAYRLTTPDLTPADQVRLGTTDSAIMAENDPLYWEEVDKLVAYIRMGRHDAQALQRVLDKHHYQPGKAEHVRRRREADDRAAEANAAKLDSTPVVIRVAEQPVLNLPFQDVRVPMSLRAHLLPFITMVGGSQPDELDDSLEGEGGVAAGAMKTGGVYRVQHGEDVDATAALPAVQREWVLKTLMILAELGRTDPTVQMGNGWHWCGTSPGSGGKVGRLHMSIKAMGPEETMAVFNRLRLFKDAMAEEGVNIRFKIGGRKAMYNRSGTGVLYFPVGDQARVYAAFAQMFAADLEKYFHGGIPHFTAQVFAPDGKTALAGVGFSQNPSTHESFGQSRSRAIKRALAEIAARLQQGEFLSQLAKLKIMTRHLDASNVDVWHPAVEKGMYDTWSEMLGHTNQASKPSPTNPQGGGQPVGAAPAPENAARIRRPEGANAVPVVKVADDTGEKMLSARTRYNLGRDPDGNQIVLSDPRVGAKHASIFYAEGRGWFIRDAGSADGTYVNDQRLASLTAATPLQDGDTIKMGSTRYRVQIKGSELSLQRLFTERVVQTEAGQHVRLKMVTEVDGTGTLRYVYKDARGKEWAEANFKAETRDGRNVVKIAYIITDPQVGGKGLSQDLINEATAASSMVWSVVDNIPTHNALLQARGQNLETVFAETPLGKLHERAGFTHHFVERFRGTFHTYSSREPLPQGFVPHWRSNSRSRAVNQ